MEVNPSWKPHIPGLIDFFKERLNLKASEVETWEILLIFLLFWEMGKGFGEAIDIFFTEKLLLLGFQNIGKGLEKRKGQNYPLKKNWKVQNIPI